jgi:hypothetical protein
VTTEITDNRVVKPVFRTECPAFAPNRHPASGTRKTRRELHWFDWLPLIALPATIIAFQNRMAPWLVMGALAASIFLACKWLTWRKACTSGARPSIARSFAYFFAWPGMDASEFLGEGKSGASRPSKGQWLLAIAKVLAGGGLILVATRAVFGNAPLITGWLGMVGIVLFLHFGFFEILALAWQTAGVNAKPIMRKPIIATSLADFWSTRWNTAFNVLAHDLAFRPLARRFGPARAILGVFLISGIVHEIVISLPARGGFGLPTVYFLFQGIAVLAERSALARRLGFGEGFRGWLFTLVCAGGPAFWLFHPPFVAKVILPMLRTIGTN